MRSWAEVLCMRSARRSLSSAAAGALIAQLTLFAASGAAGVDPPQSTGRETAPAAVRESSPAAANSGAPAKAASPTVREVTPSQASPGQTVTLALTGSNFQAAMQLDFGVGIVIVKPPTVTDSGHAQVAVQILQGTSAGRHLVTAIWIRPATLSAMPPLKTQGPGYIDVVIAPSNAALALDMLQPRQVAQGQQVVLSLHGSGFSKEMALSFGPGITAAAAVQVMSPTDASVAIQVSPQAPPILRHPTLIAAGRLTRVSPEATLTVTASSAPPTPTKPGSGPTSVVAVVPVILAVSPARLTTGQKYTLTMRGMNLVPQLQLDFGAGIVVSGGIRVQSPSEALVDVSVQDSAPTGMHWVGLELGAALAPVREDASVLVQRAALIPVHVAPQMPKCISPAPPQTGSIVLDGPLYTGYSSDVGGTFNVPVLNDQTTLTWHEANAGLADRVEVRFYSGNTLVATRALTAPKGFALPHSLAPDAALIAQLTSAVQGRAAKVVNENLSPGAPSPAIAWDLTWQVVGLHTYYDSCASPMVALNMASLGQGHEVEVEHSNAVPIKQPSSGDPLLDLGTAPTGLACALPAGPQRVIRGSRGSASPGPAPAPFGSTSLTLQNASRATQANNRAVTADYVGDHWQFHGTIDLTDSPWKLESQQSVSRPNSPTPLESESLNNVFVDWGDGTVEPLTVQWKGQSCGGQPCFASNTETSNAAIFDLDSATNTGAFGHPYGQVGSFDVRVYVLPASAVQQGAQAVSVNAGGGGLYGRLVSRAGTVNSSAASAGNLAYQLFCQNVQIQHRTDPDSNGPLQLQGIRIVGFPQGGSQSTATHETIKKVSAAPQSKEAARASGVLSGKTSTANGSAAAGAGIPQFSSCDASLVGGATLRYFGQGSVKLTWYQDGVAVGSKEEPIGPSQSRTDAQLAPPKPHDPIASDWPDLESAALDLTHAPIGNHQLQVSAEVVQDRYPVGRVMAALGSLSAYGSSAAPNSSSTSMSLKGAPALGVLAPRGAAQAGLPPIAWVNQAPPAAPGIGLHLNLNGVARETAALTSNPPNEVVSAAAPYEITSANAALPCTFNFPVTGGKFVIAGLQNGGKATVQSQGGQYSGTGVLQAVFADASGTGTQPAPVPIHFSGWTMQSDGVTVASGSFNEHPSLGAMHLPGVTASLAGMAGTAGKNVTATLSASLTNTDIAASGGSPPPAWQNIAATLSPQGDWYADNLPLPALLVYDSGFTLTAATATLDLSQVDGQGVDGLCQGPSGKSWMGVALNQSRLTAFNFDLPQPPNAGVTGWALDSLGFCGNASFGSGGATLDRGSIAWSGIAATAGQGSFSASYSNLKVHVPWLNADVTSAQSNTLLTAGHGAGQGGINLNLTSPAKVTLTEGPITLTATNLSFASIPSAGGWAVSSDTSFAFASPQGSFASGVVLHGFNYGMNGAATYADGSTTRHVALSGQKGNIGGSLADLKSVDVALGATTGANRVSFAFDSTLNLSKTLPAADVSVTYGITEPSAGTYAGSGPVTSPFTINKPFPDAIPSVNLKMTPTYVGGATGSKANSGILFSSNLDLAMFGGPPVSGQFVLGYVGSTDYWLARAILDLGPTGVVIVPPVINLYQVGGGMGYNVTLDSFKTQDLTQATPVNDGTLLFDATLLVGSPDHATFGLLGDFVIKPGGADPGGRMDYHAWLLDPNWSGQSPIYGYFSYAGGTFDGTLNAQLSLLDNQIALDATHDAIHMHVGGSNWYYHIGTQANPINGHVFFASGQAYADLGSSGFALGLLAKLDLNAGNCGGACAYIHDDWSLNAAITPSPLAFSASAQENFNLGACVGGACLNSNVTTGVSLGLPPPALSFTFGLGSCPPAQITVGLEVLPSLNPNVGGGFCL